MIGYAGAALTDANMPEDIAASPVVAVARHGGSTAVQVGARYTII